MTTFGRSSRPAPPRPPDRPPLPRRPPVSGRSGKRARSVVRNPDAYRHPVELRTLARSPMPTDVRGALVAAVGQAPDPTLQVSWLPLTAPSRIPAGRILLSWAPVGDDLMDVTARLGLQGAQVLLAVWPSLRGDWCNVVRPTVAEVMELHAALSLATTALRWCI